MKTTPTHTDWTAIRDDSAAAQHAMLVEMTGWMIPLDPQATHAGYFLLAAMEPCCGSCVPRDPLACLEVQAQRPVPVQSGPVRVQGRLMRLRDDPAGWRYRLEAACTVPPAAGVHDAATRMSRRMTDIVGVEHVGLGTDMLGFISPPVFRSYEQLPELGGALLAAGFSAAEVDRLLGGNYRRVLQRRHLFMLGRYDRCSAPKPTSS